jgi:hypothetical protein
MRSLTRRVRSLSCVPHKQVQEIRLLSSTTTGTSSNGNGNDWRSAAVSNEVKNWLADAQKRHVHRLLTDTITDEPLIRLQQTLHLPGEAPATKPSMTHGCIIIVYQSIVVCASMNNNSMASKCSLDVLFGCAAISSISS